MSQLTIKKCVVCNNGAGGYTERTIPHATRLNEPQGKLKIVNLNFGIKTRVACNNGAGGYTERTVPHATRLNEPQGKLKI